MIYQYYLVDKQIDLSDCNSNIHQLTDNNLIIICCSIDDFSIRLRRFDMIANFVHIIIDRCSAQTHRLCILLDNRIEKTRKWHKISKIF